MRTRATAERPDTSLLCSEPGCMQAWSSNYGRRYCSAHNPGLNGHQPVTRQSSLLSIPKAAFTPHWSDTDRDQEVSF